MEEIIKKVFTPQKREDGSEWIEFKTGYRIMEGTKEEAIKFLEGSIKSWEKTARQTIDHLNGKTHDKLCWDCRNNVQSSKKA